MNPSQVAQTAAQLNQAVEKVGAYAKDVEKSVGQINYEELGRQVAANVDFKTEIAGAIGKKQQILDLVIASIALATTVGVLILLLRI